MRFAPNPDQEEIRRRHQRRGRARGRRQRRRSSARRGPERRSRERRQFSKPFDGRDYVVIYIPG